MTWYSVSSPSNRGGSSTTRQTSWAALLAAVVLLFITPPEAISQGIPTLSDRQRLVPLEVRVEEGVVGAYQGSNAVWRLPDWRGITDELQLFSTAGSCTVVHHGALVDIVRDDDGHVVDSVLLPAHTIVACEAQDAGGVVSYTAGATEPIALPFDCTSGFSVRPPFLAASGVDRDLQRYREASASLQTAIEGFDSVTAWAEGRSPAELRALAATYGAWALQLPTNPWYAVLQAEVLTAGGWTTEAGTVLDHVLIGDPDPEWVRMSSYVDHIDPATGEALFSGGLEAMLAQGYIPELAMSALTIGGRPELETPDDRLRFAERLWRLAPYTENSDALYRRVAEEQADPSLEALWASRADEAEPWSVPWSLSRHAPMIGTLLNLMLSSVIALVLLFIVAGLRRRAHRRRGHGFSVGHVAAVRLAIAAFVGSACLAPLAQGIGEVAELSVMPMAVLSGSSATPSFAAYWAATEPSDASHLIQGIAAHQTGDLDRALTAYAASGSPAARVNAGLILRARGDDHGASAEWSRVEEESDAYKVLRFHRDGVVDGVQVERARSGFGTGQHLLALPTLRELQEAVHGRVMVAPPTETGLPRGLQVLDNFIVFDAIIFAVLLIIVVARLLMRERDASKVVPPGRVAWWVGVAVPGGAWQWGVFAPFATILVVFSVMSWWTLEATDGVATSALDALISSSDGFYGVEVGHRSGVGMWAALAGHYAPWIAMCIGILPLLAERLCPDPLGPFFGHAHPNYEGGPDERSGRPCPWTSGSERARPENESIQPRDEDDA